MQVGQVVYTHWCDGAGKVIDDGTVSRLERRRLPLDGGRAQPALDPHERRRASTCASRTSPSDRRALALQGPTSRAILEACVEGGDVASLKYFRVMRARIGGIPVEISRTGYTGDLGYEIWVDAADAPRRCGTR